MKNTVVIGICGRSGSGKGYVSSVFASFGGLHIDTDALYHKLLEPKDGAPSQTSEAIRRAFGDEVIKGLTVDRASLGKIVFSDKEKLAKLNRIAHRYIKKETMRMIGNTDKKFVIVDAPLLFESGFDRLCSFTVAVVADDETRVSRIIERDGITREDAARRLSSQMSDDELISLCTYKIDNSAGRDVTNDVRSILAGEGLIKG